MVHTLTREVQSICNAYHWDYNWHQCGVSKSLYDLSEKIISFFWDYKHLKDIKNKDQDSKSSTDFMSDSDDSLDDCLSFKSDSDFSTAPEDGEDTIQNYKIQLLNEKTNLKDIISKFFSELNHRIDRQGYQFLGNYLKKEYKHKILKKKRRYLYKKQSNKSFPDINKNKSSGDMKEYEEYFTNEREPETSQNSNSNFSHSAKSFSSEYLILCKKPFLKNYLNCVNSNSKDFLEIIKVSNNRKTLKSIYESKDSKYRNYSKENISSTSSYSNIKTRKRKNNEKIIKENSSTITENSFLKYNLGNKLKKRNLMENENSISESNSNPSFGSLQLNEHQQLFQDSENNLFQQHSHDDVWQLKSNYWSNKSSENTFTREKSKSTNNITNEQQQVYTCFVESPSSSKFSQMFINPIGQQNEFSKNSSKNSSISSQTLLDPQKESIDQQCEPLKSHKMSQINIMKSKNISIPKSQSIPSTKPKSIFVTAFPKRQSNPFNS